MLYNFYIPALAGFLAMGVFRYVLAPDGVHKYDKATAQAGEWSTDNGAWEPLVIGTNSRNVINGNSAVLFGVADILAQGIHDRTGAPVCIIEPAWGGIGLLPTSINTPPGPYNNVARAIAKQAYIERAVRDFAAYMPGYRLELVSVMWWQGETDANLAVTTAQYRTAFDELYAYMTNVYRGCFVTRRDPVWSLVELDFNRSAAEGLINTALAAEVAERSNAYYITAHRGKSLQKDELTSAQDDPLTKGAPTNASGMDDDNHSNYIAYQIVAETILANLIAAGAIP